MTKRKDEFFGKMLITMVACVGVSALAFLGYLGYRVKEARSSDQTSIGSLGKGASTTTEVVPKVVKEEVVVSSPAKDISEKISVQKETLAVTVLNGGAPKGSAATLVSLLKADGFAKAVTGNSVGDYSGLVVYRAEGSDSAAEAVRKALSAKYPSVSVKPADPKNSETTKSAIVVIFGK